jgi:hypothetical protein
MREKRAPLVDLSRRENFLGFLCARARARADRKKSESQRA